MKYTEPRFTKALDVFIATDPDHAHSVYAALKEFGAPLQNLTSDDFTRKGHFYQLGRPPLRADIMMSIAGIEFNKTWKRTELLSWGILRYISFHGPALSE